MSPAAPRRELPADSRPRPPTLDRLAGRGGRGDALTLRPRQPGDRSGPRPGRPSAQAQRVHDQRRRSRGGPRRLAVADRPGGIAWVCGLRVDRPRRASRPDDTTRGLAKCGFRSMTNMTNDPPSARQRQAGAPAPPVDLLGRGCARRAGPGAGRSGGGGGCQGDWLARGYSTPLADRRPAADLAARRRRSTVPFWRRRLAAAAAGATDLRLAPDTTAYRLVYAESDGLPGPDRGSVRRLAGRPVPDAGRRGARDLLLGCWSSCFPGGIVERSDAAVRRQEGLPLRSGLAVGPAAAGRSGMLEHGLRFPVDLLGGQKTGFYVDQRENRRHRRRARGRPREC